MSADTSNKFMVGTRIGGEGGLIIMEPPAAHRISARDPMIISKSDAVNLAAWLAVLADPDLKEFNRIVKEAKK